MSALGQTKIRELRLGDVVEILKLFEAEYNQPNLHDRVLIFDVVASLPRRLTIGNVKESEENEVCDENEDQTDGDKADIANDETGIIRGGNQTKTQASMYANFLPCCLSDVYTNLNQRLAGFISDITIYIAC